MRQEFISAIKANQAAFGLELSAKTIERLADYYELVQQNNPLLHLVAPCSPQEFAIRHILESLTLLQFLPRGARFADVGPGAGLPSIPCLIARDDLSAVLIESKQKKVSFLETAAAKLGIDGRTIVLDRQFEEVKEKDFSFVTCRALDRFANKLPRFLKWSGKSKLILFGGPALAEALGRRNINFEERLIPFSERRYVFIAN